MSLTDEIKRLHELHTQGALTDAEFAQAKASVLAGGTQAADQGADLDVTGSLREIHFDNELARLDREWSLEREKYMITGRYGARYLPTEGWNGLLHAVVAIFGIFWTIMAFSMGAPIFFAIFGLFFVGVVVANYFTYNAKAAKYWEALRKYEAQRDLMISQRATENDPSRRTR